MILVSSAVAVDQTTPSLAPGEDKRIHNMASGTFAFILFALCLIRLKGTSQEVAVLKLLLILSLLVFAPLMVGIAGMLLVPMLAVLPVLFAVGMVIFAISLTFGVLMLVLRLLGALFIGFGGLLVGMLALLCFLAGGAVLLALGLALSHLLLPLLVLAGLIWLIQRASKPAPPAIAHRSG